MDLEDVGTELAKLSNRISVLEDQVLSLLTVDQIVKIKDGELMAKAIEAKTGEAVLVDMWHGYCYVSLTGYATSSLSMKTLKFLSELTDAGLDIRR